MITNFKITIPKTILEDENNTPYDIAVYCALKASVPHNGIKEVFVNVNTISLILFGTPEPSAAIKNEILKSFNSLMDRGIVKPILRKKCYALLNGDELAVVPEEYFTFLYLSDMRRILMSDEKIKIRLLKYFLHLMSTINPTLTVVHNDEVRKNIIGNMSQDYIAEISGISPSAVIKYNRWLERLKVLHVYRSSEIILTENGFRQATNVYGRYENKEFIDSFASYNDSITEQEYTDKLYASDNGRRLGAMYNWLCRGKKYSEVEIKEIYNYIMMYNEKLQKLYDKYNKEEYLEQLKDTTVFEQFEFLKK